MKKLKFMMVSFLGLVGLSGIILLGSSLIINQNNQEFVKESEQFLSKFPSSQSNEVSRKLDILLVKLGLQPVNLDRQKSNQKETEELEKLLNSLSDFLNVQTQETTDKLQPIPQDLQQFLDKNKGQIIEIRDYLLTSEKPSWDYDSEKMFRNPLNYQFPNHGEIVNLQKILMLQILSDYSQGNTSEINQTLEVSFKLNQSIQSQPHLINQLVALIVSRYQLGILRQVKNLAPQWEIKLNNYSYDYQEGILNALNIESLIIGSPFVFEGESANILFNLIEKPYWKIMAKDTANRMRKSFNTLENQNICSANLKELESQLAKFPWWNIHGQIATPNFPNQWFKGGLVMLDLELTQKILQAEVIKQKTGQYPTNLSNLNSQVCPSKKWQYHRKNNQVTVNFEQELLKKIQEENQGNSVNFPLTFTLNN